MLPDLLCNDLDDMRVAVKKLILPCLLALSHQISYEIFLSHVFENFKKLISDTVWGVRKVCLEVLPALMDKLRASDTERLTFCAEFLSESLTDDNKWVRNQAYHQFGPTLHAMY